MIRFARDPKRFCFYFEDKNVGVARTKTTFPGPEFFSPLRLTATRARLRFENVRTSNTTWFYYRFVYLRTDAGCAYGRRGDTSIWSENGRNFPFRFSAWPTRRTRRYASVAAPARVAAAAAKVDRAAKIYRAAVVKVRRKTKTTCREPTTHTARRRGNEVVGGVRGHGGCGDSPRLLKARIIITGGS